ncbi:MAG: flagellar biosynthetic protein FliO [Nitrospirota bacterium]|nr:flagellar biosynthetic protein FliO [Nitrospirota bacterium]
MRTPFRRAFASLRDLLAVGCGVAAISFALMMAPPCFAQASGSSAGTAVNQTAAAQPAPPAGSDKGQEGEYLKYTPPAAPEGRPSLVASTLRVVAALALVLAALLFTLYMLKRFMDRGSGGGDKGAPIRIITSKFLGPKKSIAVVEVYGRYLVVGITPGGINLLADLKDAEDVARVESTMGGITPQTFSDFLRGSLGKRGNSDDVNTVVRGTAHNLEERLKDVKRSDD